MSRTYNAPPSVLRTKMAEWGHGLGNATKALLLWHWTAIKMGFESVLRIGRPEFSMLNDQPRQFFGLRSITQELLDEAERDRRDELPDDPFDTLAHQPGAALNDKAATSEPAFKRFHAARHAEH